jgi:transposase InsO family protein
MRAEGLAPRQRRRFRVTTQSRHGHPTAPNVLARRFAIGAPNQVWAGDITYLPTREGWLYLAVLLDLGSRRVVGWAVRATLEQGLTLAALQMALATRRRGPMLVHHSDRGSQYACAEYRRLLAVHGLIPSMSRTGDCWDNAVVESFLGTLKRELVEGADWATRGEAEAAVGAYLDAWYNRQRRHSALGYVSPVVYELLRPAA